MSYCKYKDAPPEETIKRIRKCFESVGITLEERVIKRMDGIYSSTIIDSKTGWAAAGKGTTKEYCLASGYAEAMEHFCNYCAYDTSLLNDKSNDYLDFYRYPDEKRIKMNQLKEVDSDVYNDIENAFSMEGESFSEKKAIEAWTEFLKSDELSLVPYYSVKHKQIKYLPETILGKLCGSTGGGAGNTPEEAIGHALDEISERYVKYVIYSQELTPPDISKDFIRMHCPELYSLIKTIEGESQYNILVKDASLGQNYPVLVVCLINRYTHSYIANFGSHPVFAIALERCLTEMFQFMSLGDFKSSRHKKMAKWSSYETEAHSLRNWTSLLRDDTGIIPDSFFAGKNSWEFIPWGIMNDYSNQLGMQQQIRNFIANGVKDIYIRDFSFLGFPVFRIYIPEISFSHFTVNDRTMRLFSESSLLINAILNNHVLELNSEEIELLKQAFDKKSYIATWIIRSLNENYLDLLYAALVKQSLGQAEAMEVLANIDEEFVKAIIEDNNMYKQGKSVEERNKLIELFYGEFENKIVKIWRGNNVFVNFMHLYIDYKLISTKEKNEYIDRIQVVHKKVKEKMIQEFPSQTNIEQILK